MIFARQNRGGWRRGGFRRTGAGFRLFAIGLAVAGTLRAQIPRPTLDEATAFAGATLHHYPAGDGRTMLRLYVFAPLRPVSKPSPGLVFFQGSGWIEGWITQFAAHARALAAVGLVTVCADYRTQTSHGATPFDAVADARAALTWLQAHAADLGLDPARLAAGGASSGAHLALCAAILPGDRTSSAPAAPAALVLFSAVTDTTAEGYPAGVPLFGGRERELSPRHHLRSGLPPTLLLHGADDAWVPLASAMRFTHESAALGNRAELVAFTGRGHAFFNDPAYRPGVRPEDFFTTLFLTEQFLSSLGWIAPPAVIGSMPHATPTP